MSSSSPQTVTAAIATATATATECFVCGTVLKGDEAFIEHHLNLCLDARHSDLSTATTLAFRQIPSEPISSDEELAHTLADSIAAEAVQALPHQEAVPERLGGEGMADQDVESCPLCQTEWDDLGISGDQARNVHAEECLLALGGSAFEDDSEATAGTSGQFTLGLESAKDAVLGVPCLVPVLATLLNRSHAEGKTKAAYLCTDAVEHVQRLFRDAAWGCGYRNGQMLFTALRKLECYNTSDLKGKGKADELVAVPTIPEFQIILETAWRNGYDPPGARHFGGKLRGSHKWIGTTEIYTALTFLGIRARVIDFPKVKGSAGTHEALVRYIKAYFTTPSSSPRSAALSSRKKREASALDVLMDSKGAAVNLTGKQPLYLQHQGHSRTVVGFEENRTGDWLLIFDPSSPTAKSMKSAASDCSNKRTKLDPARPTWVSTSQSKDRGYRPFFDAAPGFRHIWGKDKEQSKGTSGIDTRAYAKLLEPYRVSLRSLSKKDEYQLLFVEEGPLLEPSERLARKVVRSEVIRT